MFGTRVRVAAVAAAAASPVKSATTSASKAAWKLTTTTTTRAASHAAARRPQLLQQRGPVSRPSLGRRHVHHLPLSRHDARIGVPGLLSPEGFELAWTEHMKLMLTKLNQLVAGTDFEERDLKGIIMDTARVPSMAAIFNCASMAHNTDFFFKQIRPDAAEEPGSGGSNKPAEIPAALRTSIEDNFGSVDTLRREFAATAAGMFGPGFVWLVKANHLPPSGRGGDSLRLLVTYLAGSPYPGAHWRRQSVDMNTVGAETVAAAPALATPSTPTTPAAAAPPNVAREWLEKQAAALSSPTGMRAPSPFMPAPSSTAASASSLPTGAATDRRPPGGIDVTPLLCLSTWEHVWLRDYGLGADGYGGKPAFVEAWWNTIDWDGVADMANLTRPKLKI